MRALLATAFAIFGLALVVLQGLSIPVAGSTPFGFRILDESRRVVTSVSPEAAAAGLRVGDHYDWRAATPAERAANYNLRTGPIVLPVIRDGRYTPITVIRPPRPMQQQLTAYADIPMKVIGFAVAILLIARGRGAFGFYSGLFLWGLFASEGWSTSFAILPPPWQGLIFTLVVTVCGAGLVYFQVEAMIALCGNGLNVWERAFFRATQILGAAMMVYEAISIAPANFGLQPLAHTTGDFSLVAQLLRRVPLAGYAVVLFRPAVRDRGLIAWVFWSSIVGYTGGTVNLLFSAHGSVPAYGALNLTFVLMAFGYAYVALRYRVVDLTFVVNRALVYSVMLSVIVGGLIVTETLITNFAVGGEKSAAIQVIVALVLGLSMKHLESRINRVVERAFFAKKFAEEEGLRALIRDCAHVENPDRLARNVSEQTRRLLSARHVAVYERSGNWLKPLAASPEMEAMIPVDIDDPVVVRMRSALTEVDLGSLPSTMGNDGVVFPMLARGRIVGALACGNKPGHEAYDSDERKLLFDLAHEAGTSLLLLRSGIASPQALEEA